MSEQSCVRIEQTQPCCANHNLLAKLNPRIIQMPTKTPKPVTEFCETCDGPNSRFKWLGIARLSRIPDAGWPSRERCQKAVTSEERAAGAKIIAEYREMEQQAIDNDVSAARARIRNPECDAFEAERLREKIRTMSEEKFYGAHSRLNELREEAAKLVRPIFERLVVQFDNALQATALSREAELTPDGHSHLQRRPKQCRLSAEGLCHSRRSHRHSVAMPA